MTNPGYSTDLILRHLGDDLILRRSTPADADRLAEFNATIHGDNELDGKRVAAWTRDLLKGNHPTFQAGDFTIIENTNTGKIVSSMNLIPQTWSFHGIPFSVGRPELVGTDPQYRNRGLVRIQFDIIHEWCQQRGLLVQGITGIPYYYRLFGYEMAMNLSGRRTGFSIHVPKLAADQPEPFRIRPAQETDISFLAALYQESCQRSLVSCMRDETSWRYELLGMDPMDVNRVEIRIIETATGERAGYITHIFFLWGENNVIACNGYELINGISWLEATPTVIRYLWQTGESYARESQGELKAFTFSLGESHPVYQAATAFLPRSPRPYAWYIRVPDILGFIRLVTPVLEERLSKSICANHSGELKISLYRGGFRLVLDKGRLTSIEPWQPAPRAEGDAAFPGLTFLQLLFGYRSLEELQYAFADCVSKESFNPLLNALFPRQPSSVWPIS